MIFRRIYFLGIHNELRINCISQIIFLEEKMGIKKVLFLSGSISATIMPKMFEMQVINQLYY